MQDGRTHGAARAMAEDTFLVRMLSPCTFYIDGPHGSVKRKHRAGRRITAVHRNVDTSREGGASSGEYFTLEIIA